MTINWKKILKDILTQFSANVAIVHRFNQEDQCLHLLAYTDGFPNSLLNSVKHIPLEKGTIAAVTVSEKKSIIMITWVTNTSAYIVPQERKLNIKGIIVVPIFFGEEVVGCLGIGCYDERLFTQQETDALIEEGKNIGTMLVTESSSY